MAPDSAPRPEDRLQSERPAPQPPDEELPMLTKDYSVQRARWTTYAAGLAALALMFLLNLGRFEGRDSYASRGFPFSYARMPLFGILGGPIFPDPMTLEQRAIVDEHRERTRPRWTYDYSAAAFNAGIAIFVALAAMLAWTVVSHRPPRSRPPHDAA